MSALGEVSLMRTVRGSSALSALPSTSPNCARAAEPTFGSSTRRIV